MAQLTITIETLNHAGRTVKVAAMMGSADSSNVADIATAMSTMLDGAAHDLDVIIDGGALDYVNSTWIGHLTEWYTRVTEKGGTLLLASLRPNVHDTLAVVGLLQLIPACASVDEAKLALLETKKTDEAKKPKGFALTV